MVENKKEGPWGRETSKTDLNTKKKNRTIDLENKKVRNTSWRVNAGRRRQGKGVAC